MGDICADSDNLDWHSDKRDTAVHEAGHLVVGTIRDGLALGAFVKQRTTAQDSDRSWMGRTTGLGSANNQSAAMSVAGCAAEILEDDRRITAVDCHAEAELRGDCLSESDRRRYPAEHAEQLQAFDDALTTLRANREFFEWVVEQLVEHGCVTKDKVDEYLKSRKP